jgi:hypothetical protein
MGSAVSTPAATTTAVVVVRSKANLSPEKPETEEIVPESDDDGSPETNDNVLNPAEIRPHKQQQKKKQRGIFGRFGKKTRNSKSGIEGRLPKVRSSNNQRETERSRKNQLKLQAMLDETTLAYCPWQQIMTMSVLGKQWNKAIIDDKEKAWRAMCISISGSSGLYCPLQYSAGWKKAFWSLLYPARENMCLGGSSITDKGKQGFKIQVAARFKPGTKDNNGGFVLPLHQRLKLLKEKREQQKQAAGGITVEKKNLLKLGGIDEEKSGLSQEAITSLVEAGSDMSPELLEALLECESLSNVAKQAKVAADTEDRAGRKFKDKWNSGSSGATQGNTNRENVDDRNATNANKNGVFGERAEKSATAETASEAEEEKKGGRKGNSRVLALQQSRVVMFVPGLGIRPYHFTKVFGEAATQPMVYDNTAREAALSALNGFNSCVLCYGQTGSGKTFTMFGPDGILESSAAVVRAYKKKTDKATKTWRRKESNSNLVMQSLSDDEDDDDDDDDDSDSEEQESEEAACDEGKFPQPSASGLVLRTCGELLDCISEQKAKARKCAADAEMRQQWQLKHDSDQPPAPKATKSRSTKMSIQYLEVYQNEVTCLVTGAKVKVRIGGDGEPVLQGAEEVPVSEMGEVLHTLQVGHRRKHFAATAMNDRSSRAHTLFLVTLTHTLPKPKKDVGANDENSVEIFGSDEDDDMLMVRSRLHLVDLAGCEQIKKSKVRGQQRKEAVGINSSLLVLGKCITALVEEKSHVPYFESKLTMMLKGAFGGNSRTTAIITASMADEHADETNNALKFGERCSMITNDTKAAAATSVGAAVKAIDQALCTCREGLASLEGRGKQHLPSYAKLAERYRQLKEKRKELPGAEGAEEANPISS